MSLPGASSEVPLEKQIAELKDFQKRILKGAKPKMVPRSPSGSQVFSAKHQTILDFQDEDLEAEKEKRAAKKRRGSITGVVGTAVLEAAAGLRRNSVTEIDDRLSTLGTLPKQAPQRRKGSVISDLVAARRDSIQAAEKQADEKGEDGSNRRKSEEKKQAEKINEIKRDKHVIMPENEYKQQWDKVQNYLIAWTAISLPFVLAFVHEEVQAPFLRRRMYLFCTSYHFYFLPYRIRRNFAHSMRPTCLLPA
jgi:hypothetical protein